MISRCVELKRNTVCEDEFDTGSRQLLNLGHTVGHGIEAISNFTFSHGQAVAIGTAVISRTADALSDDARKRILGLLRLFGLPVTANYTVTDLLPYILSDKKRSGKSINLIIPRAIGECKITPTPIDKLKSIIEAGL